MLSLDFYEGFHGLGLACLESIYKRVFHHISSAANSLFPASIESKVLHMGKG